MSWKRDYIENQNVWSRPIWGRAKFITSHLDAATMGKNNKKNSYRLIAGVGCLFKSILSFKCFIISTITAFFTYKLCRFSMFLRLQCLFSWNHSSFTQVMIYFDFDYNKLIISQDIGFLRKIPIIHLFRSLNYEVTHLFIVGDYFDLIVT